MSGKVSHIVSPRVMTPIGPYSHMSVAGDLIWIAALAGVDPQTNELVGDDIAAQTARIIKSFEILLVEAGSDLDNVTHITIFLRDITEFAAMNAAYVEAMGGREPARSVVEVSALPKPGARLTMNAMAAKRK